MDKIFVSVFVIVFWFCYIFVGEFFEEFGDMIIGGFVFVY